MRLFKAGQRIFRLLVIFSSAVMLCWPKPKDDLYSAIPAETRSRFVQRLQLVIEYEKSHQWEKLYGLLSSVAKQGESLDQYSKRREHWRKEIPDDLVRDFLPVSVREQDPRNRNSEWIVFGCVTVSKQTLDKYYEGLVSAYYENEDWFFSQPLVIVAIDGPPTECDLKEIEKLRGD